MQIRTEAMHESPSTALPPTRSTRTPRPRRRRPRSGRRVRKDTALVYLRRLVECCSGANPEELLEHAKLELFQDQVFCFTPKGRLIALPRGAMPLDFAYAVHTDIGDAAVGAMSTARHEAARTALRNGDEVEIDAAASHTPPAAWAAIVVTGRARSAIRRAAAMPSASNMRARAPPDRLPHFERLGEESTDDKLRRRFPPRLQVAR